MKSTQQARLQLETLEDRLALSSVTRSFGGTITILGTNGRDKVVVELIDGGSTVKVKDGHEVSLFSRSGTSSIYFSGSGGNDKFTNQTSISALAYGGSGKDKLVGGSGVDELHGETGNDFVHGRGGSDSLYGNEGNDTLWYDSSDAIVNGGSGHNHMRRR